MQIKSTGDYWFAVAVTAMYGSQMCNDFDSHMNECRGTMHGFTLDDNCCVLWNLNENSSEKLSWAKTSRRKNYIENFVGDASYIVFVGNIRNLFYCQDMIMDSQKLSQIYHVDYMICFFS